MQAGIRRTYLMACVAGLVAAMAPPVQAAVPAEPPPQDCKGAQYRQLDFRLGDFDVTGMEGARAGDSRVESILGGCVMVEHWQGAISGHGQAIFYYDREDRRWHMTFLSDEGEVLVMDGVFDGDTLVLRGKGAVAGFRGQHRMTWSPLPGKGVKQFWEFSTDNGSTWKTVHIGYYARRR